MVIPDFYLNRELKPGLINTAVFSGNPDIIQQCLCMKNVTLVVLVEPPFVCTKQCWRMIVRISCRSSFLHLVLDYNHILLLLLFDEHLLTKVWIFSDTNIIGSEPALLGSKTKKLKIFQFWTPSNLTLFTFMHCEKAVSIQIVNLQMKF